MAWLVLDDQEYELAPDADLAALRRRAEDVMSGRAGNVGLDQIALAGGRTLDVNWRAVGTVRVVEHPAGPGDDP